MLKSFLEGPKDITYVISYNKRKKAMKSKPMKAMKSMKAMKA